jgi:predicted DNA-binding protein (MmcQ/YjbR family)
MTIEDIQSVCKKLRGVTQDIKWEDHLCFNVGEKMFIITSPDTVPVSASFKVNEEEFDELSCRQGFKPAAYLARYKWIYVDDINRLSKKEWTHYINEAYYLIASKLPVKIKREINFDPQTK